MAHDTSLLEAVAPTMKRNGCSSERLTTFFQTSPRLSRCMKLTGPSSQETLSRVSGGFQLGDSTVIFTSVEGTTQWLVGSLRGAGNNLRFTNPKPANSGKPHMTSRTCASTPTCFAQQPTTLGQPRRALLQFGLRGRGPGDI
jgi:hypothetical protein